MITIKIIYLYIYVVYQVDISFFTNKITECIIMYYYSFNFKNIFFLKLFIINFIIN